MMEALPMSFLKPVDYVGAEQAKADEQEIQRDPDQQDKCERDHSILPRRDDRQENEGRDGEGDDGEDGVGEGHDSIPAYSRPESLSPLIFAVENEDFPLVSPIPAMVAFAWRGRLEQWKSWIVSGYRSTSQPSLARWNRPAAVVFGFMPVPNTAGFWCRSIAR